MENAATNKTEALINWSKWLITIDLFSATGCVLGLKTAGEVKAITGLLFFMAILCFLLSTICSTLFVLLVSKKIGQETMPHRFTRLAVAQWTLFTLGLFFVIGWIALMSGVVRI